MHILKFFYSIWIFKLIWIPQSVDLFWSEGIRTINEYVQTKNNEGKLYNAIATRKCIYLQIWVFNDGRTNYLFSFKVLTTHGKYFIIRSQTSRDFYSIALWEEANISSHSQPFSVISGFWRSYMTKIYNIEEFGISLFFKMSILLSWKVFCIKYLKWNHDFSKWSIKFPSPRLLFFT